MVATATVVFMQTSDSESLMYVSSALSWMPVVNALSTIFFVKAYRRKVLCLFKWPFAVFTPSATASVTGSRIFDRLH